MIWNILIQGTSLIIWRFKNSKNQKIHIDTFSILQIDWSYLFVLVQFKAWRNCERRLFGAEAADFDVSTPVSVESILVWIKCSPSDDEWPPWRFIRIKFRRQWSARSDFLNIDLPGVPWIRIRRIEAHPYFIEFFTDSISVRSQLHIPYWPKSQDQAKKEQ